MKRLFSIVLLLTIIPLVTISFLFATQPNATAQSISLYIDGKRTPTQPVLITTEVQQPNGSYILDEAPVGTYYMDIPPQVKNNRTFVPIRTISKFLGADISWEEPNILITYNNTKLFLTIENTTVLKNDTPSSIEAAPYLSNGRTMVPLRFIAEAFGCQVDYENNGVYINTDPLLINGIEIQSLQTKSFMTIETNYSTCKTTVCVKEYYALLSAMCSKETSQPDNYEGIASPDNPDYYYLTMGWLFLDDTGSVIQEYQYYPRMGSDEQLIATGYTGLNLGELLIYDATHNKWYRPQENRLVYERLFSDINSIGVWAFGE